jgi:2'-5' RNA ligase
MVNFSAIMTTIRTFIAIELTEAAQAVLSNLENHLKTIAPPNTVRWTAPQNIHLTLHFLGDVAVEDVATINQVLETVALAASPFSLVLEGLGCFPNFQRPRIVWVGVGGAFKTLQLIQGRLGSALQEAIGFSPEARPYSPHLTIGRVKKGIQSAQLKQLGQALEREQAVGQLVSLPVTEISLIKSELKPTGPIYTRLSSGKLTLPT